MLSSANQFSSVLEHSFTTGVSIIDTVQTQEDGPKNPEPIPLLRAVAFSKWFILTYYIPIAIAILFGTIQNLVVKRDRKRRRREIKSIEDTSSPQTASSASSTLVGDDSTGSKDAILAENTPLLSHDGKPAVSSAPVSRIKSRVNAFFTYQPKPIPALTAPKNQLPPNDTTLVVFVFLVINVFYLFYKAPFPGMMIFVLADRAGLCFVVNLPVLYVLAAKNNQPLKRLTGWSYEKTNIFHRRLGEWMVLLGVLHAAGMTRFWYKFLQPQGYTFKWFVTIPHIAVGIGALACFWVLWITSIGYVRQKAYEVFLALHIVFQTVALVLLFMHSRGGRPYCGAALAIWAIDRLVYRIMLSSRKFIATLEIAQDKQTVLLYCDIVLDQSKIGDIRSGWKTGQHVFLTIPGMRWYHAYQAHPFTIGSPAPSSTAVANGVVWPLQLIIRCQDGFSKDLLEHAKYHQHVEIYLDGAYGDSDLAEAVASAERVFLVAGGSGITLTYPVAWSLHNGDKETSIVSTRTTYQNGQKTRADVCLNTSLPEDRHSHIWIRQHSENNSWITMFPRCNNNPSNVHMERGGKDKCVNLVSRAFDTRSDVSERPDIAVEMKSWLRSSGKSVGAPAGRVCLVVCGPDSLVRDVRNAAAALIREGYEIELHVEKFGW